MLAPQTVTALGGAYAAIADGVEGMGQNAAAPTVRPPYSLSWFDYDISIGASLPGTFGKTDFDNRGEVGLNSSAFFYTLGGVVQLGRLGFGVTADFQRYALAAQGAVPGTLVNIGRAHAQVAYTLLGDQLSVGGGVRGVSATVDTMAENQKPTQVIVRTQTNVLTMLGVSPELGMLLRPDYLPWRLGVTYRFPVNASGEPDQTATSTSGVRSAGGLPLPARVHWPWELEIGVALSAGPRPLNPKWLDPHEQEETLARQIAISRRTRRLAQELELSRIADPDARAAREAEIDHAEKYEVAAEELRMERQSAQLLEERRARYKNWPRARIAVMAEVLVTGPTDHGISLQSFLRREDVPAGGKTTVQPRLGIEGEPVPYYLVARVGTYIEPSRYELPPTPGVLAGARQHFTFGLDVKTITWNVWGITKMTEWRVTFAGDVAPRYQNIGLSVGTWH